MRYFFVILITFLICVGCKKQEGEENISVLEETLLNKFYLIEPSIKADSNNLIFFTNHPWDTSFVLILKRKQNEIRGVYYQTNREYSFDGYDYLDEENEQLYLEGFSFKTDTLVWAALISESKKLLESSSPGDIDGCLDCPNYFMSYNSRLISLKRENLKLFEEFENFIKEKLMKDIFRKKVTVKGRIQKEIGKTK